MKTAIDSLAAALYGFIASAPTVSYQSRRIHSIDTPDESLVRQRPLVETDVDVDHFRQTWSNTATMFSDEGILAGQAFTNAYTTIITHEGRAHVHCDGRPCYEVDATGLSFVTDSATRSLGSIYHARNHYEGFKAA